MSVVASITVLKLEFEHLTRLPKSRGCAQPHVYQPQLVNYIEDDYVRRAGSPVGRRSSDPRGDPA